MNQKVYAILLTLLMTLPVFSKVVVYINWKVNQDYISKNLCINKGKPVLKCKGKCQLMMKMKDTEPVKEVPSQTLLKDLLLSPFIVTKNVMHLELNELVNFHSTHLHHHSNKFQDILPDKRVEYPPDTKA